jgi:hypothetical protein
MRIRYQTTAGLSLSYEVTAGLRTTGTVVATGALSEQPIGGGQSVYSATPSSASWPDNDYRVRVFGSGFARVLYARLAGGLDGSGPDARPAGSDLGQIMLWARQRLVDKGLYKGAECLVSLEQEPHPMTSERFGIVSPGRYSPGQGSDPAARGGAWVDGSFSVRCYSMSARDTVPADTIALAGHTGLERDVARAIDLVNGRWAINAAGDLLALAPVALAGGERAVRYRRLGNWRYAEIRFAATYLIDLNDSSGC